MGLKIDQEERKLSELRERFSEPLKSLQAEKEAAEDKLEALQQDFEKAVVDGNNVATKKAEKDIKAVREDLESIERRLRILNGKRDDQDAEISAAVMACIEAGEEDLRSFKEMETACKEKVEAGEQAYLESLRELSKCHTEAAAVARRILKHGGKSAP